MIAYSTGVPTTVEGVLDAVRLFAIAQGWSVNRWQDGNELCLESGSVFANLYANNAKGELWIRMSDSYDSGQAWDAQPLSFYSAYRSEANDMTGGPFVGHHLFADGSDYIHGVVETSTGKFTHFGFGLLQKIGTWSGGEYCFASWWYLNSTSYTADPTSTEHAIPFDCGTNSTTPGGTFVRQLDGYSETATHNGWKYIGRDTPAGNRVLSGLRTTTTTTIEREVFNRTPSTINLISPLIAPHVWGRYSDGTYRMLGHPKGLRFINCRHIADKTILSYGAEEWMVFPVKQRGEPISGSIVPCSRWYGLAYRKA